MHYERGTFIYRLAGRDREKSASYYTPEVLTQCLVKYALKELLKDKTADSKKANSSNSTECFFSRCACHSLLILSIFSR